MSSKARRWIAVISVLLLVIAAVVTVGIISEDSGSEKYRGDLYFLNETGTSIEAETREISYRDTQSLVEKVIKELKKGPEEGHHQRSVNKKTTLLNVRDVEKGDLIVDFSREFLSGDSKKDLLSIYAVVRSLCAISNIRSVKIVVENKDIKGEGGAVIGYLRSQDINLANDTYNSEMRSVALYFQKKEGNMLKKEVRSIRVNDQQPLAQYIINELIKGPKTDDLSPTLSKETVLLSVQTSNNICFVNFKSDFLDKNSGKAEEEKTAVYSIVDSLTELDNIERVQFLIDGKRVEKFGELNIFGMFGRDESVIE